MTSKRVIWRVTIEWGLLEEKDNQAPRVHLTGEVVTLEYDTIRNMLKATEAIEELGRAIAVAKRLAELKP